MMLWRAMNRVSTLLFALPLVAVADPLPTLPLFTAICTGSQSTGFARDGDKWAPADFRTKAFTVQKIDPERSANITARSPCGEPETAADSEYSYAFGCYVIGTSKGLPAEGERCIERFKAGVIQAVYCDTLSFLPDGEFLRVPDAKDFEPTLKGSRAVVVSVGRCVRVAE